MSLPVWVVSLALLFWGWQAGNLPWAAPLAVLLVLPRWVRQRTPLSDAEFHRVLDVCWVLGIGGLLLIYSRESVGNIVRAYFGWLPLVAYPALLAQVWSTRGMVPASALLPLPTWRRRTGDANPEIDLMAAFFLVCLLSASVAAPIRTAFFPALAALLGLALWTRRQRAVSGPVLSGLLVVVWTGGWALSQGLAKVQPWIEGRVMEWTAGLQRAGAPGSESRTAIGRRGRIGGSGRVVLKVRSEGVQRVPRLLRTAVFSVWQDQSWYAARSDAEKIEGTADEWRLDARPGRSGALEMEWVVGRTEGLVPLPAGTRTLRELVAESVERTPLGTVRAEVRGGVASLRADYAQQDSWESPPRDEDRFGVSPLELSAVEEVMKQLDLAGRPAEEVMRRLDAFFTRNFRYTLDLKDPPSSSRSALTPLGRFLLEHREGHCEYFATAAALLLRSAGIPARYVTGFAVDPAERQGDLVTVRESSAHAWVRVWKEGTWVDFDPTPAADFGTEEGAAGAWVRLRRAWHELWYSAGRWWWLGEKRWLRQAYWIAVPLLVALVWRFRQLRVADEGVNGATSSRVRSAWPGSDSEWFLLEAVLAATGLTRGDLESVSRWTQRLATAGWTPSEIHEVVRVFRLHERLRFDPRGLPQTEREGLRLGAGELERRVVDRPAGRA